MACTHAVQVSERFEDPKESRVILSRYCVRCQTTTWYHHAKDGRTTMFWSLALEARKKSRRP